MVVDLISLFSSYFQYELLILAQNQELVTEEMASSNDLREQVIGIVYTVIYLTSAVVYIRWFKSAYSNLAKRTVTNEKVSMAIWGWIIPFISLFKPYQMIKEMWTDTSLQIRLKEPDYQQKDTSILGFWWFLWLITNVIGNFIFKYAFKSETIQDYINLTISEMVLSVLTIPLAILAYIIIEQYNEIEVKLTELEAGENTNNSYE
tara:strand:+ start:742 stop:1356 length:615 start_codon:yes stop_codon:yes gene_type:complete